jgi:hypothetical protein
MIAVPCSPIVPERRIRSPGRMAAGGEPGARVDLAHAGRADVHPVGVAALDHLRVPGDDLHLSGARGGGDRVDLRAQVAGREALLEDEREREGGRARAGDREVVDRAVDGEVAIDPPGKRSGLTTKESVVIASRAPPTVTAPASASSGNATEPSAGPAAPSIIPCVALPPAPWPS